MRIVFLVLVLANLGLAAWYFWLREPGFPTRPMPASAPTIELLGDRDPDSSVDAASAAATAGANGRSGTIAPLDNELRDCFSMGPFSNRLDVEEAVAVLRSAGFQTSQRTAQGEVWLGRWVYIDAIATQDEAEDIVTALSDEGITEAYVIADGNNGNIVSLGVFSEQARAQQRLLDAQALGLSPVVADRSQPGEVFWVDVTADGRAIAASELPPIEVDPEPQLARCTAVGE